MAEVLPGVSMPQPSYSIACVLRAPFVVLSNNVLISVVLPASISPISMNSGP